MKAQALLRRRSDSSSTAGSCSQIFCRHAERAQRLRVAPTRKIARRAVFEHRDIFVERLQRVAVQLAPGPGDAEVLDHFQRQDRQPDRRSAAFGAGIEVERILVHTDQRKAHLDVGQRLLLGAVEKIP